MTVRALLLNPSVAPVVPEKPSRSSCSLATVEIEQSAEP
jgi:hypothetical protein